MEREAQVRQLSQALLREYMHKKGYKETLAVFDKEEPRDAKTINSRKEMTSYLDVSSATSAFKTFMEMLVDARLTTVSDNATQAACENCDILKEELKSTNKELEALQKQAKPKEKKKKKKNQDDAEEPEADAVPGSGSSPAAAKKKKEKKKDVNVIMDENAVSTISYSDGANGVLYSPPHEIDFTIRTPSPPSHRPSLGSYKFGVSEEHALTPTSGTLTPTRPISPSGGMRPGLRGSLTSSFDSTEMEPGHIRRHKSSDCHPSSEDGNTTPLRPVKPQRGTLVRAFEDRARRSSDCVGNDDSLDSIEGGFMGNTAVGVVMDECQDMAKSEVEDETATYNITSMGMAASLGSSTRVGVDVARKIKTLMFGDRQWNASWAVQGLFFSQEIRYGLVQKDGGPCGPLAVIQAYVLKDLIFDSPLPGGLCYDHIPEDRLRKGLASAMASILMNIARAVNPKHPQAFLAMMPKAIPANGSLKENCAMEDFVLITCTSQEVLQGLIFRDADQYMAEKGNGLLLFLVSAFITRLGMTGSADMSPIRDDMDAALKEGSLVVQHGYSSQEFVNLLLCGKAKSNVFDGDTEMGDSRDRMCLGGIPNKCDIGFLTLYEHHNYCKVGSNLKCPKNPIWVICSESHFTVLAAKDQMDTESAEDPFNLFYYDQLGCQDEEIKLTVDPMGCEPGSVPFDDDMVPPIDDVIRTKWPGATINWNSTDPLL